MRRLRPLLAVVLISASTPLLAGPMTKNIESVRPRIGQRGTTVEVRIQGVSLARPREIRFFRPGIRAFDVRTAKVPPRRRSLMHRGRIEDEVICKFEIAPDCPLGEHAFRLLTATELTCIATFHVSPFPVVDEAEGATRNDTRETAQPVSANVTVRGRLDSSARGDRDLYRVDVKSGQRISAEVQSVHIADNHYGDSEFDLAARIVDASGRILAANDDNPLRIQDPVLSAKIERDGVVYVEVKRSVFAQRETVYCVHIGSFRRPLAVYPPGGPSGAEIRVRVLGDPLGDGVESLHIPASRGDFEFFGGAPTGLRLRSCPYPNVLEDAGSATTHVAKLPAALNGVIETRGDVDTFLFPARKGEKLRVRVFAASLGSPIDASIRIRRTDERGEASATVLQAEDSRVYDHDVFGMSGHGGGGLPEVLDPTVVWAPDADGVYALELRDTGGAGGATSIYRVEVEPLRTMVHSVLRSGTFDWSESTRVTGLAVPRGSRWTVNLDLPRGQWERPTSEFELVAHGLPKGVRLLTTRVPVAARRWPVQFVADSAARATSTVIRIEARSVDGGQPIESHCQQNVPFINHSGGDAWRAVRTKQYVLGVTDVPPFDLSIDHSHLSLVRGGSLAIPVKITRREGFQGSVELRCTYAPGAIGTPPPLQISGTENEGVIEISASAGAALGTQPLVIAATCATTEDVPDYLGAGHIRVSSRILDLDVIEPFVELTASPTSIRRGETKEFVWSVRQRTAFEGHAKAKLLGLPKGVTVLASPRITRKSNRLSFRLSANDDALLGQVKGLSCEIRVRVRGQEVRQRTGRATLRIDPRLSTSAEGKR
ncbi:MAG: serine protease [Planctomycetota bacterium]